MQSKTKSHIRFLLMLLSLGYFSSIYAQTYQIEGQIQDANGQSVEVGNVLILSPDSTLVLGDMFLDGYFTLSEIPISNFIVKTTALGYKDHFQTINVLDNSSSFNIGITNLKLELLEGVEVIARQNMVEVRGTDLIVQVENTALSGAGTVLDVIRNAPKVVSGQSGQLSIIGKGQAVIYLNGQQIASTQILNNLSANDVKQIEIIENPGAQYDAAGNAVINIITKRKTLEGYKIGLLQEGLKGKFWRTYFQGNVYYKLNKVMLQASYGIRPRSIGARFNQLRDFDDATVSQKTNNWNHNRFDRLDHDISLRSTIDISSNQVLGVQYSGGIQNIDKTSNNSRDIYDNETPISNIQSNISGPTDQNFHTANVYYNKSIDTLGSTLKLSSQISTFDFDRSEYTNQLINDNGDNNELNLRSDNTNAIKVYTGQIDYTKKYPSGTTLSTGLKNAYVTNNSGVSLSELQSSGSYLAKDEFSNEFEYSENIASAYSELTWTKPSYKFILGLRSEWTITKGASSTLGNTVDRNFINVFPSASITKQFKNEISATIDYSYRINRPVFQDLNPYLIFVDSLLSLRGNPMLQPEYSHSISSNINFKKFSLGISHIHSDGRINQIFRSLDPNNTNNITFIKENLEKVAVTSLSLSIPYYRKGINANMSIGAFYDNHQIRDIDNSIYKNDKVGFNISAWASIQLPLDIKLDLNYNYVSSKVDGIYVDRPISYLHATLSKSLLKDQLMLRIRGNDMLDKFKFRGTVGFNNMQATYLSEWDWHYVQVSLNWNFGKLNTSKLRNRTVSKNELNRINRGQ